MTMGDEAREQSEFNMAVSYLNRLNALFYTCDEAAMGLDAHTWFHSLMALFRELSTEMKPKELTRGEKIIEKINPKVAQSINNNQRSGKSEIPQELYSDLHKFEMFIRGVLKSAGLQNKMADEASRALH